VWVCRADALPTGQSYGATVKSAIRQIRPANQADSVRLSISKKASGREGRLPVAGKRIEPADTFRMPTVAQRDAGQQRRSEARRYRQRLIE
jgi:hypothetical protein